MRRKYIKRKRKKQNRRKKIYGKGPFSGFANLLKNIIKS